MHDMALAMGLAVANVVVTPREVLLPIAYDVPLRNCRIWESSDLKTWKDVTDNPSEVVWILNSDGKTWDVKTTANHARMYFRVSGEPGSSN
jgi:hypothetical protein